MFHPAFPYGDRKDPRRPLSGLAATQAGALVLLLLVACVACRNEASRPPANSVTSQAGPTDPAEAGNLDTDGDADTSEHPGPADEQGADQRSDLAAGAPAGSPEAEANEERAAPHDPALPNPGQGDAQTAEAADPLPEYPLQDNPLAGCSLCHVDVEDEFVGTLHFEEKVGCSTCHGPSEAHLADENNEVKPDEVFARENVDRLCGRCHECPRPKSEKLELTPAGEPKVCTDCHGPHDLAMVDDAGAGRSP